MSNLHASVLRLSKLFTHATAKIAKQLAKNAKHLTELQQNYSSFSGMFTTVYFYEEYETPMARTSVMVGVLVVESALY